MRDGLGRPPAVQQRRAVIVESFDVVRISPEEDLEMTERALVVAEHRVGVSEMLMDLHVVGPERLHALELDLGQLELTAIREEDAEVTVTDRATGIRLERASPERLGVAPDLHLMGGQVGQTAEPHNAEHGYGFCQGRADQAG